MEQTAPSREGTLSNLSVLQLFGTSNILVTLVSNDMFVLAIAGGDKYCSELLSDGLHHLRAIVEPNAAIWVQTSLRAKVSYRIDYEWELEPNEKDDFGMTSEDWNYLQLGLLAILTTILLFALLSFFASIT